MCPFMSGLFYSRYCCWDTSLMLHVSVSYFSSLLLSIFHYVNIVWCVYLEALHILFFHLSRSSNLNCFMYSTKYVLKFFFSIQISSFPSTSSWKESHLPTKLSNYFCCITNYHRNDWLRTKILLCYFMGQQSEKGSAGVYSWSFSGGYT